MKERIIQEIEKTQKRNEEMLKALVPCWTEIEQNRGFILGLKYALMLLEEQEASSQEKTADEGISLTDEELSVCMAGISLD